jgi:plasmid stabilization system protein ParE
VDFQVVWTEPALDQFEEAVRYAATESPAWAEKLRAELLETVATLARLPFLGPVYERDRRGRTREVMCQMYRVFYRVDEPAARVEVLSVWHAARPEPRLPR